MLQGMKRIHIGVSTWRYYCAAKSWLRCCAISLHVHQHHRLHRQHMHRWAAGAFRPCRCAALACDASSAAHMQPLPWMCCRHRHCMALPVCERGAASRLGCGWAVPRAACAVGGAAVHLHSPDLTSARPESGREPKAHCTGVPRLAVLECPSDMPAAAYAHQQRDW